MNLKKTSLRSNFKKKSNSNPYFNFDYSLFDILEIANSYRFYFYFLAIILVALLLFFLISIKFWIFIVLLGIGYFSTIVDYMIYLPYSSGLGIPIIIVLASQNNSFFLVMIYFFVAIILPRAQLGAIFEPLKLLKYLWLFIILKLMYFLPFKGIILAIIALLLVEIVNYFLNKLQYLRGADIMVYNLLKNVVLVFVLLRVLV